MKKSFNIQSTFLYTQKFFLVAKLVLGKTTALDLATRQEEEEDEEVIQCPIYQFDVF